MTQKDHNTLGTQTQELPRRRRGLGVAQISHDTIRRCFECTGDKGKCDPNAKGVLCKSTDKGCGIPVI